MQKAWLGDFHLNYLMIIKQIVYYYKGLPFLTLSELPLSLTWKIKSNLNQFLQRSDPSTPAFISQEANWFYLFTFFSQKWKKSTLWDKYLPFISEWHVLCHCYNKQSAPALFCKDQGLVSHPSFVMSIRSPSS